MASRNVLDPTKSSFDIDRARQLLYLGKLARKRFKAGPDQLLNSLPGESGSDYTVLQDLLFSQIFFLRKKSVVFGFVAQRDNEFFIVFRGSQTIGDWVSNTRFYQSWKPLEVEVPGKSDPVAVPGYVHKGFRAQYTRPDPKRPAGLQSISESIRTTFAKHFDESKPIDQRRIYIAGHSLGGALATLAAAELRTIYKDAEIYLYTSASPRVGNSDFEDFFDAEGKSEGIKKTKAFRIFNTVDAVPNLPPRFESPMEGPKYVHVGEPFAFTNNSRGRLPQRLQYQHTLPIYACALGLDPEDYRYDDKPLPFNC
ncbi:lipase family protein [Leptothoe spongobia]|uniref:Lipase family protein n=1 Tax=Leptothoe spongobia TAU-MAC 1115 TaxID=1967444 RepID=A0A947GFZ2_9CYAN|nr:lipase family protein [Leptothoe spongobia]MBT9314034.1 lipase family protein [Leptothoe spongobia TAU-MAC 1115]